MKLNTSVTDPSRPLTYHFGCDYDVGFDDDDVDDDGAHGMCNDCGTVISSFAVDAAVWVRSVLRPNRFDRPDDWCRCSAGSGFDFH